MALMEINWHPDGRSLRRFGAAALVVFAALAAWVLWRRSLFGVGLGPETARAAAVALAALAGACGLLAAVAPRGLRPLYVGLALVGLPIGWVVSHAVLALVFFAVVTPIGLGMRLLGRDPLRRWFDRGAATYWSPRRRATDVTRYFRPF